MTRRQAAARQRQQRQRALALARRQAALRQRAQREAARRQAAAVRRGATAGVRPAGASPKLPPPPPVVLQRPPKVLDSDVIAIGPRNRTDPLPDIVHVPRTPDIADQIGALELEVVRMGLDAAPEAIPVVGELIQAAGEAVLGLFDFSGGPNQAAIDYNETVTGTKTRYIDGEYVQGRFSNGEWVEG